MTGIIFAAAVAAYYLAYWAVRGRHRRDDRWTDGGLL